MRLLQSEFQFALAAAISPFSCYFGIAAAVGVAAAAVNISLSTILCQSFDVTIDVGAAVDVAAFNIAALVDACAVDACAVESLAAVEIAVGTVAVVGTVAITV